MANITLQFGKYRGRSFENIVKSDREYLVWLAKADISRQNASKEALDFLGGDTRSFKASIASKEEIEAVEEQVMRDQEEYEEIRQSLQIEWVASSGQQIEIKSAMDHQLGMFFRVSVDGKRFQYEVSDIKACQVPNKPEIVAKLGPIGLTAERRNALLKMAKGGR